MRIGILTFHCAHNYGAVLQAFALQEFLKSCGHTVEIIDYRPSYLLDPYYVFPTRRIVRHLFRKASPPRENPIFPAEQKRPTECKLRWLVGRTKRLLPQTLWYIVCRRRGFKNFISQKLNLSMERFSESRAPKQKYEAIVFGSDQIWSPGITLGDPVFLGDFATDEKTLRIAYAASAGEATEVLTRTPAFADALKNFDVISVREQSLADALRQNFGGEIKVVLDPTLLVDKSVWDKIAILPQTKRKYVLVYQIRPKPVVAKVAHELAEQIDADVVSIWAGDGDKQKGDLARETPERFIGWFKNAACVVTTSFHGTAFSVIYEKPLYYVSKGKEGTAENRVRQILHELGLLDRIVTGDSHPKFSKIDYGNSKALLETIRSESREFLEQALTGKSNDVT